MNRRSLVIAVPAALAAAATAQAQEVRAGVEVAASAGYSSNPFSENTGDTGSGYGAVDITPQVRLLTERSTFTVSGLAHVQEYLNRYPTTDSYRASLDYRGRPSAKLTTFAHIDLSSAVLGTDDDYVSSGSRLSTSSDTTTASGAGAAAGSAVSPGTTGTVLSPDLTSGPLLSDIGLLGTRDRRRSLYGTAGLAAALSAHDSLTASGFVDIARYSQFGDVSDYDGYGGTVGYSRQVSAYFNAGVQGSTSRYDYRGSRGQTSVNSVAATATGRLDQYWTVDGSLGVSFIDTNMAGSSGLTSLSGNIDLCRQGARDTLCLEASRQARATGFNGAQYVTTGGVNWRHRIDARSRLVLDASYLQEGGLSNLNGFQDKYLRTSAAYDRQLTQRLRALASVRYRQVFGGILGNTSDYGGQIGLSYRFGDIR